MRHNFPYNPHLIKRAQHLRSHMTPAEKKLWFEFLSMHSIRFLRQRPIGNYIVDFYCASRKLVIETDGDSHYTEEALEYDQMRTDFLKGNGITVIRFTNAEIVENFDAVCAIIETALK